MRSTELGSVERKALGSTTAIASPDSSAPAARHPAHVVHASRSRVARAAWIGAGSLLVGLGLIGVVVPGWPTTIFVILAATCYARSSQRLYDRVIGNRLIGRHARAFREAGAMPVRAKAMALGFMWPFVALSVLVAIPDSLVLAKVATLVLALIGTAYILHLPSTPRAEAEAGDEG